MEVRGRMGNRYEDVLYRHAQAGVPDEISGHSGYFTKPGVSYDPRLFVGEQIKPAVRKTVLDALYGFWDARYTDPESWSTVWLAGSGVSHQWNAERGGVGDLDVLVGVDTGRFIQLHPEFRGVPEMQIADRFNKELHDKLWPTYANYSFRPSEDPFEVTFYVNHGAADIRDINPYAAYNLTADEWTVKPVELPDDWDPYTYFPTDWWGMARTKMAHAQDLLERYRKLSVELAGLEPWTGRWVNASAALKGIINEGVALFDEIHLGRKGAFSGTGKGYFGPENAIWQYGKLTGVIDGLRQLKSVHAAARNEAHQALYGGPVASAEDATQEASLWATKYRER